MFGPSRSSRWIVPLAAAALLLVQLLGLHHHRHLDFLGHGVAHGQHVHFADGGLHAAEAHDEQHPGHDSTATSTHGHLHVDIETPAIKPGLAKVFLDALLFTVVLASLLLPARGEPSIVARPPADLGRRSRSRFSLGPPSQAPPLNLVAA